jgi:FAD-dependent urate hydroxylase
MAVQARGEFARMNFPAPNWVLAIRGSDGQPMHDVFIVCAGLCGHTAGFALERSGCKSPGQFGWFPPMTS